MKTVDTLRRALASIDRVGARWAFGYTLLHLTERVVLVGIALWFLRGSRIQTALLAGALGALVLVRAAVRAALMRHVEADLHGRVVDKLLEGNLLSASAVRDDDPEASLLDGIVSGSRLLGEIVPELAADLLATIGISVILLFVEPARLLYVGGLAMVFAGGGVLAAHRIARREEERSWSAYRPVIDGLVAAIGARLEIVANGVSDSFREERHAEVERWKRTTFRSFALVSLASRLPIGVAVVVVGTVVLFERSLHDELSATIFAHAALFGASLPAIASLGRNLLEVTRQGVHFATLASLLEAPSLPSGTGQYAVTLPASIAWQNVSVRYAGSPRNAVADISMTWEPGTVLILRGPNGSGKSTLLRSLLAVMLPAEGSLRCADRRLDETDLHEWRRSIAYLAQRPFLPSRGNVREAFAIVAPEADEETVERALQRVGLLDVLRGRMPDTPLAADVGALSVGERQRLALARVLANEKPLVLLDEPDANLDRAGVELLADIVRELVRDGSMVAIAAHTDEIVALGDHVVTLERGRIV
ncbi:ATP-binding cassette domain-containing protein [Pendulispora albinea]|uniref:ATP-binding cassette domain-containing protein n=1 Tax=Pendulispora albinea TaxID=2741071 RepID=A0ABZ2M680_9BACT